jgi:hypothetical protein
MFVLIAGGDIVFSNFLTWLQSKQINPLVVRAKVQLFLNSEKFKITLRVFYN